MIIKNVTETQLSQILNKLNKKYNNNIIWNNYQREGALTFRITLKVLDSKNKGARRSFNGRRLINACWHVHGDFFEELLKINPKVVIKAATKTIDINGGNWTDWNIGSMIEPLMYSEACKCHKDYEPGN